VFQTDRVSLKVFILNFKFRDDNKFR